MAFSGDSKPTGKPTLQHHIAFGRTFFPLFPPRAPTCYTNVELADPPLARGFSPNALTVRKGETSPEATGD
jgi:hypothetical protein